MLTRMAWRAVGGSGWEGMQSIHREAADNRAAVSA